MADPYVGQIEAFAFGYAPKGWLSCAGQTLPIDQYQALFSLLGTTYGGDGVRTFQLPDLRSRLAVGQGNGQGLSPRSLGQNGGEENHTLLQTETPAHTHPLMTAANPAASDNTNTPGPTTVLAQSTGKQGENPFTLTLYAADTNPAQTMAAGSIGTTGGTPHANLMPYLALNFCISLFGIFPSRN